MNTVRRANSVRFAGMMLCLVVAGSMHAAPIEPAADAPQPHPPEESIRMMRVSDGFRVELVASEPALADPVAMAFDAAGRIFVCEIHGYNLEGHLDVAELNKTGVLDTKVRRILANEDALRKAEHGQYGTVKLLEDTDGDGRVDKWTVWADRLPPCYGIVPARGGVIVLCAPDVVFLADGDGDGKAEVRQTLFSGFGVYEMWSRINNPRWGLDNWIYAAGGIQSGGTISGPNLPEDVQVGATSFRFKPDGSALEPCTGPSSGFGQAIDDWGDRFLVTNQQHVLLVAPLPYRYLARNPFYAAPDPVVNISSYGHPARVYPTSRPHPWRQARSENPEWVKFYGAAEATANGFFTAASGQTIYQARRFPEEYWGNHFSVDNAQNLIHRSVLDRERAGYSARRPPGEEDVEFLASTEEWFRPVNLTTGPDGALYVVDMYREIIEDYSAIPRYLQQQYGLITGGDRGRIYRIVAEGAGDSRKVDLDGASTEDLIGRLSNPNIWSRKTAQRLLVERGDRLAAGRLSELASKGEIPQARIHALHTLAGLELLDVKTVRKALDDPHFAVRMHAVRLAEPWLDADSGMIDKLLSMTDDADPKVRLQLAFTLGQSKDIRTTEALAQLATAGGNDEWMQAAILSSVAESSAELLAAIISREGGPREGLALLKPLAAIIGTRRDDREMDRLLLTIVASRDSAQEAVAIECLAGFNQGLKGGTPKIMNSTAGRDALRLLLVGSSTEIRKQALLVAASVRFSDTPEIKSSYARAAKTALDETLGDLDRELALTLFMGANYATLEPVVRPLLDARQPLALQLTAVRMAASCDDPRVGPLLLESWPSYTPKVQDAVIEGIFGRHNRLVSLLDVIGQGVVPASALDASRSLQLTENSDESIRDRAKALLTAGASPDRQEVVARYTAALASPGDPGGGEKVYEEQCAKCHRLQGQGFQVGPDLETASSRTDETIMMDILDPSSQLTVGYQNYTVITEDGRIFTGVLSAETATGITLRKEEGVDQTILRKDVDEMAASPMSMMPGDLEKEVTPGELVDLIAYIRKMLGPVVPGVATLFDDDRSFAELLNQGAGTARIDTADPFVGQVSLAISPPQRFSDRIQGWEYPIRENPQPGEFRYLRFAWKSRGGAGPMIELAAQGRWPAADKPLRRYYSGKNTTDWQAVQVASERPDDWVVVTRDLWKDFGSFTLTGIAPTAMGGEARFDSVQLFRSMADMRSP
jgi:putative membrane-bound dehydrogenase-like protein